MNYNTMSLLGDQRFHIKSWGKPLNVPRVIVGRLDNGMKVVGHHPSDATQQVAQFTYDLHRKSYALKKYNGFSSHGAIGPFGYVTTVGGVQQTSPVYNPAYSSDRADLNVSGRHECYNIYVSRCGDGYLDTKAGSVKPGYSNHAVPLHSDTFANEQCDPGADLASWADDVMPNGQPATAQYNCTPTCTINEQKQTPPNLIIDKQQKLHTGTVFSGVGLGTPSDIEYDAPSKFEFKIIISNVGGDATQVVMKDVLPDGFVVDPLPGGCSGSTSQ